MSSIKHIIFYLIIMVLLLPLFQMETRLFKVTELAGWFKKYERPEFRIVDWFEADFQDKYTDYFENNFGFRPWFVKIRNQILFTFFNKAKATAVEIGKDNYLYELNYIRAFNGLDYRGDSVLQNLSDSLNMIDDILSKHNIDLIICFAAGKGSFYPEYFPNEYPNKGSDLTNYKVLKNRFLAYPLHVIDFNEWFMKMKDTSKFMLYPKYGIHWSEYGAILAGDSLLHYIEEMRSIDLPDVIIDEIKITRKLQGVDYDIAKSLNLIFQLPSEEMAYPKIHWNSEGKDTCTAIVISDSFYWQLYNRGWGKALNNGGFWYYNELSYPGSFNLKELDYIGSIYQSDVVILLATEATLDRFPFGFIHDFFKGVDAKPDSILFK